MTIGTIVWAYSRARTTGRIPEPRPLNADAAKNAPATRVTTASNPRVWAQRVGSAPSCTVLTHQGALDSESYAVEPSRTPTTANRPGAAGVPATPTSGLRTTSRPSPRRPSGESRPASDENTSKPSPLSNQRDPKNVAASRLTAK